MSPSVGGDETVKYGRSRLTYSPVTTCLPVSIFIGDNVQSRPCRGGLIAASTVLCGAYLLARAYLPPHLDLKDKTVIITGGSSGIGKAIAKSILARGGNVILVARRKDRLEEAKAELTDSLASYPSASSSSSSRRILLVTQDVTVGLEPVESALGPAIKELGGVVDVLINCAGISVSGAFDEVAIEAFEDMMRVNFLGSIYPTRAVLPLMKDRKAGSIVFVSSQAGQVGIWGYSAYSSSKFALRGLAQALQMEVHPYNIYVSVVYPPDTNTPGFQIEELSKPAETSLICGAGTLFEPERVADDLVRGIERRQFSVYTGFEGFMMSNLCAGLEPVFSLWDAFFQVGRWIYRLRENNDTDEGDSSNMDGELT